MRMLCLALALLASACSPPPPDNAQSNSVSEQNKSATAAPSRYEEPAPDESEPPRALPAPATAPAPYTARGQEPGWALTIAKGRIDYQGNYGEKRIETAAPEPQSRPGGRRYVTKRLTVDIVTRRCNDAMSGQGFEDEVTVTADGETYRGCGGTRRPDWDM